MSCKCCEKVFHPPKTAPVSFLNPWRTWIPWFAFCCGVNISDISSSLLSGVSPICLYITALRSHTIKAEKCPGKSNNQRRSRDAGHVPM